MQFSSSVWEGDGDGDDMESKVGETFGDADLFNTLKRDFFIFFSIFLFKLDGVLFDFGVFHFSASSMIDKTRNGKKIKIRGHTHREWKNINWLLSGFGASGKFVENRQRRTRQRKKCSKKRSNEKYNEKRT